MYMYIAVDAIFKSNNSWSAFMLIENVYYVMFL